MKNKLVMMIFLVFLFSFYFLDDCLALNYLNSNNLVCTETKEHKEWEKLSDADKSNTIEPTKCEESKEFSNFNLKGFSASASKFDLRNVSGINYTTPVKNQVMLNGDDSKLCWAFATAGAVESSYLFSGGNSIDISERHIDFSALPTLHDNTINKFGYKNRTINKGGNYYISGSYLAQKRGVVLETKLPFETLVSNASNTFQNTDYTVGDVNYYMSDSCQTENTITDIKNQIATYGAVAAKMSAGPNYLSTDKSSYYYNGSAKTNHAITIIGWDDNYSKDKFKNTPPGDGAWLIKDSYLDIGQLSEDEKGYFYVSYYDTNICSFIVSVGNVKPGNKTNKYINSLHGWNGHIYLTNNTIYYKELYSKKSNNAENLESVTIFTLPNDKYEVYYSDEDSFANATKIAEGTGNNQGYTTVDINSNKKITSDNFYIFTKYTATNTTDNDNKYIFPVFYQPDSSNSAFYMDDMPFGVAFYSTDANQSQWIDTVSDSNMGFYPLTYVFTNNIAYNLQSSTSISDDPVTVKTGGDFYIPLTTSNIDNLNDITVKVLDANNVDKTNLFDISQYDNGYKITVKKNTVTAGNYKVEFTYENVSTYQNIEVLSSVSKPITNIIVDGLKEVSVNGTLQLTAVLTPTDATIKKVKWESSDETIAIVNDKGIVTGLKEGNVTITATSLDGSDINSSITISVIDINKKEGNGVTEPIYGGENKIDNAPTGMANPYIVFSVILILSIVLIIVSKKKKIKPY